MGLSRRSFLKILSSLPVVAVVPKVTPAFATSLSEACAQKEIIEVPSLGNRTDDKGLQLRFEDIVIDCISLSTLPVNPPPSESWILKGMYYPEPICSYLSVSTDYFKNFDRNSLTHYINKWMYDCSHSSDNVFKNAEIYYEEELLARIDYLYIRSFESAVSLGGSMKFDLTFGYDKLEMLNG